MSNNWYTPSLYIEAAHLVMGGIDLDPASCEFANRVVKAKRYFTAEDNGLMYPWIAESVWLNPPYGKTDQGGASYLECFTHHLLEQYICGNTKQAILLIPNNTATSWFTPLWKHPICFPSHRVHFYTEKEVNNHAAFGGCFIYLGPNESRFVEVFRQFGTIVRRISLPKQEICTALDLWSALTIDSHVAHESCRDAS